MRLTNEMRNEFADKVMKKIPIRSEWTRDKIIAELKQRLLLAQPSEVQRFAKKYPQQINWTSVIVSWLNHRDDDNNFHYGYINCIHGSDPKQIETDDLREFYTAMLQEMADRKLVRERIYEQACCANTVEQLRVIFPDMPSLIPKPAKVIKSLPVAAKGLTNELVKLGMEIPA